MKGLAPAALASFALSCAAPRLADPWAVAGARFQSPLGACLPQAIRSSSVARYEDSVQATDPTVLQTQQFRVYDTVALATERACADGTYYVSVRANVAAAEPASILPVLDDVVAHISTACGVEPLAVDGALLESSADDAC